MRIAFHTPHLTVRGTDVAAFQYADYNEKILGNESLVLTFPSRDLTALPKFKNRFGDNLIVSEWWGFPDILKKEKIDWLYISKAGGNDGFSTSQVPCFIHAVFCSNDPHGDRYVYISDWLAKNQGYNPDTHSLPYIVERLPFSGNNMRNLLNIPKDAIVFGCYAGSTEFNIRFVHDAIINTVKNRKDVYFIFMNINKFCEDHHQIIHLPASWDLNVKSDFIHTCDAMIHARGGGETFGCAVAEFAIENKPVITYSVSGEACHIELLGERGIYYKNYEEIYDIFNNLKPYIKYDDYYESYKNNTPEIIMAKFNKLLNTPQ